MEIVASEGTPFNTTDFSTTIEKLVAAKPDAIGLYHIDTQLTGLITGLRRAGFEGKLFVYNINPSTLEAVGDAADGLLMSIDYSPAMSDPSSKEFTDSFRKKFDDDPTIYAANGYDAVLFLSAALEKVIKAGNKPDRENLLAAISEVAQTGFAGASGDTTFDDKYHRDARVNGVLVRFDKGKPNILFSGKDR